MKNKIIYLALCLLLFCGCDKKQSKGVYVTHLPVQVDNSDEWSFVDRDGNIILQDNFESTPSPVVDGFFSVEDDEGYSIYTLDDNGKATHLYNFDYVASVGFMQNNLMPICKIGERISVVDQDGICKFILDKVNGQEVKTCYSFTEGLMKIRLVDNTFTFVNTKGVVEHTRVYTKASSFFNGYALVSYENESDNDSTIVVTSIIDLEGNDVYALKNDEKFECFDPYCDKLVIKKNEDMYIVDLLTLKKKKLSKKVNEVIGFHNDYFIYENDKSNCGVMSYDNEILVRPKYEYICCVGNRLLAKHEDIENELRLIDENDNILKTFAGEDFEDMFYANGLDFPLVVETEDDEYDLISDNYESLCRKSITNIEKDFYEDGYGEVDNYYVPIDSIINILYSICLGNNDERFGIWVKNDNVNHCTPKNISFIRPQEYVGKSVAKKEIQRGFNYNICLEVAFDMNIANNDYSFNDLAWVLRYVPYVEFENEYIADFISKKLCKMFKKHTTLIKQKDDKYWLYKDNNNNQLILVISNEKSIFINVGAFKLEENWKKWIDNTEK